MGTYMQIWLTAVSFTNDTLYVYQVDAEILLHGVITSGRRCAHKNFQLLSSMFRTISAFQRILRQQLAKWLL